MAQEPSQPSRTTIAPVSADEAIDEASEESFPASDPPSSWSGGDAPETEDEQAVHPA
jgi:hypothetical protein